MIWGFCANAVYDTYEYKGLLALVQSIVLQHPASGMMRISDVKLRSCVADGRDVAENDCNYIRV